MRHWMRHWRQVAACAAVRSGASATPRPHASGTEDEIPRAGASNRAGGSAIDPRLVRGDGAAPVPQQQGLPGSAHIVPGSRVQRRSLDELRELPQHEITNVAAEELYRVANSTRSDVTELSYGCEAAERAAVLRTAAGLGGAEPLTRGERALAMVEWLWSFEDDWRARSAPESHMEAEWGGGAPT